jgi:hypothetical protein|tara:strand:- start:5747 stop:5986 length:240 start_codon:yes stop_codon:yes gene_type:complete
VANITEAKNFHSGGELRKALYDGLRNSKTFCIVLFSYFPGVIFQPTVCAGIKRILLDNYGIPMTLIALWLSHDSFSKVW